MIARLVGVVPGQIDQPDGGGQLGQEDQTGDGARDGAIKGRAIRGDTLFDAWGGCQE